MNDGLTDEQRLGFACGRCGRAFRPGDRTAPLGVAFVDELTTRVFAHDPACPDVPPVRDAESQP